MQSAEQSSEVPEASSIGAHLYVQQYVLLRSEIEKRVDLRQQMMALTLVAAGTFLSIGVQPAVNGSFLLFYPILIMFLAGVWAHNDLRIGQIADYIQREVEKHFGDLRPGWEEYRRSTFRPGKRTRTHRKGDPSVTPHPLAPSHPRLIEFANRGLFIGTQCLIIAVAAYRFILRLQQAGIPLYSLRTYESAPVVVELVLFTADVGAVLYTGYLMQHRRARAPEEPAR